MSFGQIWKKVKKKLGPNYPKPLQKTGLNIQNSSPAPKKAAVGGVYNLQDTFHITRESLNKIITHCRQELPLRLAV